MQNSPKRETISHSPDWQTLKSDNTKRCKRWSITEGLILNNLKNKNKWALSSQVEVAHIL